MGPEIADGSRRYEPVFVLDKWEAREIDRLMIVFCGALPRLVVEVWCPASTDDRGRQYGRTVTQNEDADTDEDAVADADASHLTDTSTQ